MRRIFPRFCLETAPIERAFVIVLCEGLFKNHRTSFFLNYHGSFLLAIEELFLNIIMVPCCILAGDCRAPIPPLRSREDQVSCSLDLLKHVNVVLLLHFFNLMRTVDV